MASSIHNSSENSWCTPSKEEGFTLTSLQLSLAHERWVHDARAEHASVASFSRFSLQLMAVAAPSNLIAGAHSAALDEIRHAQLCFGLAQSFSQDQAPIAPGNFVIPSGTVEIESDIGDLVFATTMEGCVGETVSTVQAFHELAAVEALPAVAQTETVKNVLSTIATDEAKHAALAWETIAWAMGPNSPDEEKASRTIRTVIETLKKELASLSAVIEPLEFVGAGLTAPTKAAIRKKTLEQLVLPALNALLAKGSKIAVVDLAVAKTFDSMRQHFKNFNVLASN